MSAVATIKTPFLILHGDADPVVRPEQCVAFVVVLEAVGVERERVRFPGEGHPIDQSKREEVSAAVRAWFANHGVK